MQMSRSKPYYRVVTHARYTLNRYIKLSVEKDTGRRRTFGFGHLNRVIKKKPYMQ